jgi:hypothetical protein
MADIAVVGLDDENLEILRRVPGGHRYHELLGGDRVLDFGHLDMPTLVKDAQRWLDQFPGGVDAIVGYWDCPVSSLVPLLARQHGLRSAPLEAVVRCEHKYWSRLEQSKVIDDHPAFGIIDVEQPPEADRLPDGLSYPVWLKPVKSASSELAFHVASDEELAEAMAEMRAGIDTMGAPFRYVLDQVDLPADIAEVGSEAVLVEESVSGEQVTVEGFVHEGDVSVHGIIDSLSYPESSSFWCYRFPSAAPERVQRRLADISAKVIRQLGLTNSTFNIEYFWDPGTERISLLEVNPRHSQSHAFMFEYVNGVANHAAMVQLALGERPHMPDGEGRFDVAAKFFLRHFEEGVVLHGPSPETVERIERRPDGVHLHVVAWEGDRLADLPQQDSYSYELARIHVGGRDWGEVQQKYEQCVEMLGFEVVDTA